MIVAGIDVGGRNVHVVIMREGRVVAKAGAAAGIKKAEAAEQVYDEALKQAGLTRKDVERVVATGSSGRRVAFANSFIADAAADARGVIREIATARTVIDVGGEEGRAIKISAEGKVLDFAVNERCAAGTGTFVDAMARALEMPITEMAEASLKSTRSIPMNAQCAVFSESEVVSLIHQKTPKPDIARAVNDAIAGRVGSLARVVGLEDDVVAVGGLAKNRGFVESLKRDIGKDVKVPEDPDFIGALGAAVAAGVVGDEVRAKVGENDKFAEGKAQIQVRNETTTTEAKKVEYWRWPESVWVNPATRWRKGKLVTAGVDIGSVSSKCVIMVDGALYAYSSMRTGSDSPDSANRVVGAALEQTDMKVDNFDYCIGTGYGRVNVPMAQQTITEIACHARGANWMYGPEVRTVLDIGGQDCKAIRCDERGKVLKFMMNDKCAAGTGRGMEVFADLIRVPVWEIGPRSFQAQKEPPPISSMCVVFAKTEVVGLLERGVPENEIMAAYCAAMSHRILELLKRLGIEEKFAITGGIAKNEGVVKRLEKETGMKTMARVWARPDMRAANIPFDTMIAGGIGAALFAQALLEMGKAKSARKA